MQAELFLSLVPHGFLVGAAVALGLLFGSFLNVVIYRLPRGLSVAFPPSTCPACSARIQVRDNVPVLSWLLLRARARCCKAKISPRYPLVELLGGGLSWALLERLLATFGYGIAPWKLGLLFLCLLALSLGLLALIFIDLEHMLLPDELTLGGTLLGLITVPLRELSLAESLAGGLVGFMVVWLPFIFLYAKWRGVAGMGLGDAKLLMLAGVWFGWQGALFALMAGALQGTAVAIAVYAAAGKIEEPEAVRAEREELQREIEQASGEERQRLEEHMAADLLLTPAAPGLARARIAFGPFLALSMLEFLFFGSWLIDAYLNWLYV